MINIPLKEGSDAKTISDNIKELIDAGHDPDQAAAIAYKNAGVKKSACTDLVEPFLTDEASGEQEYKDAASKAKDPELKKILLAHSVDEARHLKELEDWMENQSDGESMDVEKDVVDNDKPDDEIEKSNASLTHYKEFHDRLMADPRVSSAIKDEHKKASMGPAISAGKKKAKDSALMNELPDAPGEEEFASDEPEEYEEGLEEAVDENKVKKFSKIFKMDDDRQIIYGVCLLPDTEDLQNDVVSKEEVEKACHYYNKTSKKVWKQHKEPADAEVLESYIYQPLDVPEGSWVAVTKVHSKELWDGIKRGDFTGYSIGGRGARTPINK